jgi:SAM-dependent MidA family methyltransferase
VWSDSIAAQGELRACVQAVLEEQQEPLPVGYTSEVNLNVKPWFAELGASFVQGVVFCIDYGYPRAEYYHPQRVDGTLMCHYRHRAHTDPLILVGQQDITAFVDFTAVTEAGTASGFELAGYATQAHFLMGCGLGEVLRELQDTVPDRYSYYADHAKYLTLPGEMGERFKVIALAKGSLGPLIGFRRFDQRERL